jgi:hypothetical protein
MPGKLRGDAWCPVCGRDLLLMFRTTSHRRAGYIRVTLEFEHNPEEYPFPHMLIGESESMDRIYKRLNL